MRKPNLLVILIDDLRHDEYGAGGHPYMKTPHIDRIAREGARFTRAFHTTPICSPNRASIVTGQYASRHGIIDNVARQAMSHRLPNYHLELQRLGDETAHIGKWHMGNDGMPRPGYDYWVSYDGHGKLMDPTLNHDGLHVQHKGYITDIMNRLAVEYLERTRERLRFVVPAVLAIIFVLICAIFRRPAEAAIIMLSLPFALAGGLWLVWLLGHAISVASLIGFIALAGVAAEFGIIMLLYLRQSWERTLAARPDAGLAALDAAIREGAVQRVRPKAMTVAVIIAGLLPILLGGGAGSEVMQRIAAPMVGGMLSAPLLSMIVIPAAYRLLRGRGLA